MSDLYWLSQITPTEKSLVGDKILLLSQFSQYDFPIVPGFAIASSVFQEFLASLDDSRFLIGNLPQSSWHLNTGNYQILQAVATKSRQIITQAILNDRLVAEILAAAKQFNSSHVILRPSLVVPYYQQQGSFGLWRSQVCFCSLEGIAEGIKKVWADLFSAKSLFYWDKLGVSLEQIKLAILVQPISNAIASGTIDLNERQAIIQANWGLGHSIQRGEVETDRYLVDIFTAALIEEKIGLKTRSYRLQTRSYADRLTEGLEYYLLEESKQEIAVLETAHIKHLIKLIHQVIEREPEINYIEWVLLPQHTPSTHNGFCLTQLNYFSSAFNVASVNPTHSTKTLLRGINASRGSVTGNVLVYDSSSHNSHLLTSDTIFVTQAVQPDDLPLLHNVKGIITEIGGKTSHGAILARELGIPALVGVANATKILQTGTRVTLDADRGVVYIAEKLVDAPLKTQQQIVDHYIHPTTTNVPIATQLMVNLSQVNSLEQVTKLPIDGVGLLRGEFAILELLSERSLLDWLQSDYQAEFLDYLTAKLAQFARKFAPKPIYYRAIDFSLSEGVKSLSVLGKRGTFNYLNHPQLLQIQLTALAKVMAAESTNFKLILPFVRSLREWQSCRDLVQKTGLSNYPQFQLWMMAEVPSTMFLLPEYVSAGVQGIAIGMNDLSQLILGVDREQEFATQAVNDNLLALERAIAQLIQAAKTQNIPCSICLSDPSLYPNLIDKLIQCGISLISVESQTVNSTYQAIARAEKRLLLQQYSLF